MKERRSPMTRLAIATMLLAITACGGGDAQSGDSAESASAASTASAQDVARACLESSNESAEICACIGERAVARLDDRQVAFLAAYLSGDRGAAEAMSEELGISRTTQAMGVLSTDPASCETEVEPE
jgi:hypothetical protein